MKSTSILPWLAFCLVAVPGNLRAAWVIETADEFLTSGDMNGDGLVDGIVVDRATGVARVGTRQPDGSLAFAQAWTRSSGVADVTSVAFGRFNVLGNGLAVTNPDFNAVNVVAAPDVPVTHPVNRIGPRALVALGGGPLALGGDLVTVTSRNDAPEVERIESWVTQLPDPVGVVLERGNETRAGGFAFLSRGTGPGGTDHLRIFPFIHNPASPLEVVAGSEWIALDRPGDAGTWLGIWRQASATLTLRRFEGVGFGAALSPVLPAAPALVLPLAPRDGTARFLVIDGSRTTARVFAFPGALPLVALGTYPVVAGDALTGALPLGDGFALLSAPPGQTRSIRARAYAAGTGGYAVAGGASNLTPIPSAAGDRGNVFAMTGEVFVDPGARFLAVLKAGDWSSAPGGVPPAFASVTAEIFGGASGGLGMASPRTFSQLPAGSAYTLANQYLPDISVAAFGSPRGQSAPRLAFSPPPGRYPSRQTRPPSEPADALPVSMVGDPFAIIYYRRSTVDPWQPFSNPVPLESDATLEAYADNGFGRRSPIQRGTYLFGDGSLPPVGDTDADGNGLGDDWEKTFALSHASGDADGDGGTNREEHDAGTDPRDPASTPVSSGDLVLYIRTEPDGAGGRTAVLFWPASIAGARFEGSLDLRTWSPITAGITQSGGFLEWRTPNVGRRFYRLAR